MTATSSRTANGKSLVDLVGSLPTLPVVALQLGEIIHERNVNVQRVAEVMRGDPSTSSKLLKLVNSAYFAIPGGVSDVARAIPFIGFNTLYQLVLSVSVLDVLRDKHAAEEVRTLWIHSLAVASLARELAVEVRHEQAGAAFTAGLLHDMGTIALAKLSPAEFVASRVAVRDEHLSVATAEERHGLVPHDVIGAQLAKAWRFPAMLAVPIEHHHAVHEVAVRARLTPGLRQLTEIVAAADHLAEACAETFGLPATPATDAEVIASLFERAGLTESQRVRVLDAARVQLERSKIFLSLLR